MVTFRKKTNRIVFTGFEGAKAYGTGPLGKKPGKEEASPQNPHVMFQAVQTAYPVVSSSLHVPIYLPAERTKLRRGKFVPDFQC